MTRCSCLKLFKQEVKNKIKINSKTHAEELCHQYFVVSSCGKHFKLVPLLLIASETLTDSQKLGIWIHLHTPEYAQT